jgi:DNA-binding transcriptional regulator YdaS (Cro superfamily)
MARPTPREDRSPSAETLGRAIKRAMKSSTIRTQVALAEALGVDQTLISRMVTGKVSVTVERVREIEDVCGLPRGQVLRWAGYVEDRP